MMMSPKGEYIEGIPCILILSFISSIDSLRLMIKLLHYP